MQKRIEWAESVLVVCTEIYKRRFEGDEEPGEGLGVSWEGTIIMQELYQAQSKNTKFIPIVFSPSDLIHVPAILNSKDKYILDDRESFKSLCYRLKKQSTILKPRIGKISLDSPPDPVFFDPSSRSSRPRTKPSSRFSGVVPTESSTIPEESQEAYRKKVKDYLWDDGKISDSERHNLNDLIESLGIIPEKARELEQVISNEFGQLKNGYEKTFQAILSKNPLIWRCIDIGIEIREELQKRQEHLGLTSKAAKNIEKEFLDDFLISERRRKYTRLSVLLRQMKWKEADQETAQRMCEVMGRRQEGWLREEDIQQFPCTDLRTIDQLWVKYSSGKSGFSVQKQIWEECGSPRVINDDWERFGNRIGWRTEKGWLEYNNLENGSYFSLPGVPSLCCFGVELPSWLVGAGECALVDGWEPSRVVSLLARKEL